MKVSSKRTKKHNKDRLEEDIVQTITNLKSKRSGANKVYKKPGAKKAENGFKIKQTIDKESDVSSSDEIGPSTTKLCLKDVMDLGGTEDDFNFIKDLSDNENDFETNENDKKPFDYAELVNFMKSNGLRAAKKKKTQTPEQVTSTSNNMTPQIIPSNPSPHLQLLFKANEPWYTHLTSSKAEKKTSASDIQKWRMYAEKLWENEVQLSGELRDKYQSSDQQWMKTVFSGGTTNDKVSAHCLLLQESPIHHMSSLEALLAMAKKKSKRLAIQAIDSLKEMFLSSILPENRKLLLFSQHDFGTLNGKDFDLNVMGWLVEDKLKAHYGTFIEVLKVHLSDNEVPIRTKICNIVFQLLNEKPEKEQELLSILVNKIGDPDNKLASKIIYILSQLLKNHPSMKKVVAMEVERILFRPNISERAQYYSVCFLNQLQLSADDSTFAAHLIEIYFKFFSESIEEKNLDSRMLGGLLTGVNRSYPYTDQQSGITDDNINTLFKLVYVGNLNVAVQALMLLYQVSGNKSHICNRFFQALYSKLIDPSINSSSKKTFLLNLIYKSLKRDENVVRKVAIARRLLQMSNLDDPVLACASLYTISEANKIVNTEKSETDHTQSKDSIVKDSQSVENPKEAEETEENKKDGYDPKTRNPLYSQADQENLWEFSLLRKNFHPSVNQFVSKLLAEGDILYEGDPFHDFTRTKFLEKFVFKNPKKGVAAANRKFYSTNKSSANVHQVYSADFKDQKPDRVNADEQFFYEYFKVKRSDKTAEDREADHPDKESKSLDFVDDIKDAALSQPSKKEKQATKEKDEDGDDLDSDDEFSYDDIDEDDDEPENLTEEAYEKFLWENLDSDGESIKEGSDSEPCLSGEEMADRTAEEDEWEDLEVGDSSDEDNDKSCKQPQFLDADDLDDIILHSKTKKKSSPSVEKHSSLEKKVGKSKKRKLYK